jgi:hypothetical protein
MGYLPSHPWSISSLNSKRYALENQLFKSPDWFADGTIAALRGLAFLCLALSCAHSQDIPTGFSVERYASIWQRNPFVLEKGTVPQVQHSRFQNLSLTSWLIDAGKEVIWVENTETKEAQRICGQPNQSNVRLIALHLNPNPRAVEAVISDGKEQGTVRFRYDDQPSSGAANSTLAQTPVDANAQPRKSALANSQPVQPPDPPTAGSNRPRGSRLYPGLQRVHWEGGKPGAPATPAPRLKRDSSTPAPNQSISSNPAE